MKADAHDKNNTVYHGTRMRVVWLSRVWHETPDHGNLQKQVLSLQTPWSSTHGGVHVWYPRCGSLAPGATVAEELAVDEVVDAVPPRMSTKVGPIALASTVAAAGLETAAVGEPARKRRPPAMPSLGTTSGSAVRSVADTAAARGHVSMAPGAVLKAASAFQRVRTCSCPRARFGGCVRPRRTGASNNDGKLDAA